MRWIIEIHFNQPNFTLRIDEYQKDVRDKWKTYAIPAEEKSGTICLNGPPAHLFQAGDVIIILSLGLMTEDEIAVLQTKIVFVDELNQITRVETHHVKELKQIPNIPEEE